MYNFLYLSDSQFKALCEIVEKRDLTQFKKNLVGFSLYKDGCPEYHTIAYHFAAKNDDAAVAFVENNSNCWIPAIIMGYLAAGEHQKVEQHYSDKVDLNFLSDAYEHLIKDEKSLLACLVQFEDTKFIRNLLYELYKKFSVPLDRSWLYRGCPPNLIFKEIINSISIKSNKQPEAFNHQDILDNIKIITAKRQKILHWMEKGLTFEEAYIWFKHGKVLIPFLYNETHPLFSVNDIKNKILSEVIDCNPSLLMEVFRKIKAISAYQLLPILIQQEKTTPEELYNKLSNAIEAQIKSYEEQKRVFKPAATRTASIGQLKKELNDIKSNNDKPLIKLEKLIAVLKGHLIAVEQDHKPVNLGFYATKSDLATAYQAALSSLPKSIQEHVVAKEIDLKSVNPNYATKENKK